MNRSLLLMTAALAACLSAAVPAYAQQRAPHVVAPGASARISAAERIAVMAAIAAAYQASYVFPEKVAAIVARLNESLQAGEYDLDEPGAFAGRVTQDLRDASGDGHAYMLYDPAQYAAAIASKTNAPAGDRGDLAAYEQRIASRDHHGLTELRRLPGNIRYLRITGFEWVADETGAAYDDGMRFLKGGDAVIVDLRGNGGGSHAAVRYLVSHFLDGDTLEMTFLEGSRTPEQSRTLEYLPAGRLKGKPLYVLIDNYVGSAAEAFAYDVQQFHLGELVGATTAGAANNNKFVPVAPGFMLSVPVGRPVHPVSNANWEGVGVAPTIATNSEQALDVAQSVALARLAATPDARPEDLADWAWARGAIEARLHPVSLSVEQLKSLEGRYGKYEVVRRDTSLWLIWPGYADLRLSPMTADGLFATTLGTLRLRLSGDHLEVIWANAPAPRVVARS